MLQVPSAALAQIIARPETFLAVYRGLGGGVDAAGYVRAQLGTAFAALPDAACAATFAAAVAFNVAPAGTTTLEPLTATLHELLTAEALSAEPFCKLSALLALIASPAMVPPDAGSNPKATLHFLTWIDTVPLNTGAHTQLVITNVLDNAYLLLDPMYAFALCIPFVGSGPQAHLTLAGNVASMMQVPIAQTNLALLDPSGTGATAVSLAMLSGTLGPQYLDDQSSSNWDRRIAQVLDNLG
jgi:hypothetical protein